jgi:hypothetical protein
MAANESTAPHTNAHLVIKSSPSGPKRGSAQATMSEMAGAPLGHLVELLATDLAGFADPVVCNIRRADLPGLSELLS